MKGRVATTGEGGLLLISAGGRKRRVVLVSRKEGEACNVLNELQSLWWVGLILIMYVKHNTSTKAAHDIHTVKSVHKTPVFRQVNYVLINDNKLHNPELSQAC